MPYPHDSIVRAWLDGKKIEYLDGLEWKPLPSPEQARKMPHIYVDCEYRIAPRIHRTRVALFRPVNSLPHTSTVDTLAGEKVVGASPNFVRWITDWIEYEE